MDRHTGKLLTGREYTRQCVIDVLTTPMGTRVGNRDYGSRLFDLVDNPASSSSVPEFYAAVSSAIGRLEGIELRSVAVENKTPGRVSLDLDLYDHNNGEALPMGGIDLWK